MAQNADVNGPRSGAPRFKALWPTQLMTHTLPGADAANPVLAAMIETMDTQAKDLTTDYLSGNLFESPHPALQWLRGCVDRAVMDFARNLGIDYQPKWQVQAWPNVNRFGDYHNLHNHPHSWLSGTYYVQMPEPDGASGARGDLNPNAISFFDPRGQANMMAVRGDGEVDPEHRVVPAPGDLLVWPSFLHHLVHPNLSRTPRISISFNVVLRWSDDYLP